MRWAAFVLAAGLVMAAGMGSAQTPPPAPVKLALVIGNADYDGGGIDVTPGGLAQSAAGGYLPDLRNPINDASDIRDALTRIGFKVDYVANADRTAMSVALATFGTKVAEAPDTAQVVIYYAGHAMQVDGVNYLIPARARLPAVDFSRMPSRQANAVIEDVTVPIQRVVDQLREPSEPGVNLLILDACRDNPWDSRVRGLTRNGGPQATGLAQVAAPDRTIVSYSTALNRKALDGGDNERNSPFAAALKNAIGKPGTITDMLDSVGSTVRAATFSRQVPWHQGASIGRVCFVDCTTVLPNAERERLERELSEARAAAPPPPRPAPLAPTTAGTTFKDPGCEACPTMVVIPAGSFFMGSPGRGVGRDAEAERPQHRVTFARPFALSQTEVTFAEYQACSRANACTAQPVHAWTNTSLPVVNITRRDADRYIAWLNKTVGGSAYRLPSEAEWEYAARGNAAGAANDPPYPWGRSADHNRANFKGKAGVDVWESELAPAMSFPANPFGLYQMHGNAAEYVADCWFGSHAGAPADGSARLGRDGDCSHFVEKGGKYWFDGGEIRSASRAISSTGSSDPWTGMRIARDLTAAPSAQ